MCLLPMIMVCNTAPAGVPLVHNGKAAARIYVSEPLDTAELSRAQLNQLTTSERQAYRDHRARTLAVEDLRYHLTRMTGVDFEVVQTNNPADVKAPALVFGQLAVELGATPKHTTSMRDAYRLIVNNDGLVLFGGESDVAASHAVYRWLGSLGCYWLMPSPDGEVIPKHPELEAEPMDEAMRPAFEVRAPWYSGGRNIVTGEEHAQFEQWKRRMGQTHEIGRASCRERV